MRSLCYNSLFQQLAYDGKELRGRVLNRVLALLAAAICLLAMIACGGSNNSSTSVTTPNGNTVNNPSGNLKNRAYISNQYSGNLQIVDSANDTTAFYNSSNTNTSTTNQIVDLSVNIAVGVSATFLARSPDGTMTAVYDPTGLGIGLVDNSTQTTTSTVSLPDWAAMEVFSPDSTTLYVPTGNQNAIQVIDIANSDISTTYTVPSVRWIALNPAGTVLLAFADNSDSMWLINLGATTITPVAIPGFSRPVNAFFSSDGSTAYVLNCGNQCGGSSPPSVAEFNMTAQTITTSVQVGGASVGLLNSTTLYVAGYAGGANGTFDIVDVSAMARTTANSILINDGQQWKMGLNNNKVYVGAKTCNNTATGCLSVINLTTQSADSPLPPLGPVTGILSVPNRTTMYVIEGGVLYIYDTTTDQLQKTQLSFRGALYDVAQIDQ
jgi:hypothetical protein